MLQRAMALAGCRDLQSLSDTAKKSNEFDAAYTIKLLLGNNAHWPLHSIDVFPS